MPADERRPSLICENILDIAKRGGAQLNWHKAKREFVLPREKRLVKGQAGSGAGDMA